MSLEVLGLIGGLWGVAWLGAHVAGRRGWWPVHRHRDVLALGLLGALTAGFFWRILWTPDAWTPAGGGDLASFLYPLYNWTARTLKTGIVPLWNPYLYSGAPFVADVQTGVFYPINLLVFFLAPSITYDVMEGLAVFHVFLAGALTYVCVRGLEPAQHRLAALLGAVAFMFSDLFIVHLGNLNLIAVTAWLPLVFLCYVRALRAAGTRRWAWAIAAGLVLGVAFLAGHLQPILYIVVALGLAWLVLGWPKERQRWWSAWVAGGLCVLVTGVVAVGVAAVQLWPSVEMTAWTHRAEVAYTTAAQYSLMPGQLVGLLVPGVLGRDPMSYWGPWDRVETGYIGVLPLLLALYVLLRRRDRLTLLLAALAGMGLLLALGGNATLHGWFYQWVPGFDKLRAPARAIVLFDFGVALLAARGLGDLLHVGIDEAQRRDLGRVLRVTALALAGVTLVALPLAYFALLTSQDKDPALFQRVATAANGVSLFAVLLAASLALLYARWRRWGRGKIFGAAAVALVFLDLTALGANVDVGNADPTRNFQHPAAVAFLKADPDLYRIDSVTECWDVWQPDIGLLTDIYDVMGVYNPLMLAHYDRYWATLGSRSSPLYDFLNAKYVIGHKDVPLDWDKFELAFDGDPDVNIYRNRQVLPRALVVHQAIVEGDPAAAEWRIHQPGFSPTQTVVLKWGDALDAASTGKSTAQVTALRPNDITVAVHATAPGYLVLSEVYYPGWLATVDNVPAPVILANTAFRAVPVPVGDHSVRLWFAPDSMRWGALISLSTVTLGLMGIGFIGIISRARPVRRRATQQ
ncbi:MAG: YfhO family protein [Chloroflexi bacterium]|nr:YfhO family protein [Chloroflexota bacterium]MBU1746893.1 YfhO family protein [Chloroflexota bacterium]MBU1879137.1 YfhO family protein [Chloroflexota bacterium]